MSLIDTWVRCPCCGALGPPAAMKAWQERRAEDERVPALKLVTEVCRTFQPAWIANDRARAKVMELRAAIVALHDENARLREALTKLAVLDGGRTTGAGYYCDLCPCEGAAKPWRERPEDVVHVAPCPLAMDANP